MTPLHPQRQPDQLPGGRARRPGSIPIALLREFGLPPGCLAEPDLMIPVEPVRQLLEAAAERSGVGGLRPADGGSAQAVEPRAARHVRARAADAARGGRGLRALRAAAERGPVPHARGKRRRGRAARGTDRRARRPGAAVDGARHRRRLPDAAQLPRARLEAAAGLLRARRAARPFGAHARVRPRRASSDRTSTASSARGAT